MTRAKKIYNGKLVYRLIEGKIWAADFWADWEDLPRLVRRIEHETQCSKSFIRRIYFKNFKPYNKELLDERSW